MVQAGRLESMGFPPVTFYNIYIFDFISCIDSQSDEKLCLTIPLEFHKSNSLDLAFSLKNNHSKNSISQNQLRICSVINLGSQPLAHQLRLVKLMYNL